MPKNRIFVFTDLQFSFFHKNMTSHGLEYTIHLAEHLGGLHQVSQLKVGMLQSVRVVIPDIGR